MENTFTETQVNQMAFKLVVINTLKPEKLAALEAAVPGIVIEAYPHVKEALPHVGDADAIAMWGFQDAEPLLQAAPKVRWVHSLSDGVERLLTPSMMTRPIVLTNSHGVHDRAVSEHAMALLLSWFHRIPEAVRHQDAHEWKRPRGDILYKKHLLLAGFGGIGRAIAERARVFGMTVTAVKRTRSDELFADKVYSTEEIMTALPEADVVIAALPATKETENFFDADKFAAMKKGALFINIARASVVDEKALITALEEGRLAGAALDVFSKEPLPAESPLWDMKNVIMTPHIASMTPDFWDRLLDLLKENLTAFTVGQPMRNVVDKKKGY